MKYITAFIGISVILMITGCKKSPELASDYVPVFNGNVETVVSYKKTSFAISFDQLNPANAEDCGFEWGDKSSSDINVVSIGKISDNKFSFQLDKILDEQIEYQVRAWILVGLKKFYSPTYYFYGKVAVKPEIVSINTPYAFWGDSIKVKVRNVPSEVQKADILVKVGDYYLKPSFADTALIIFQMPHSKINGKFTIKISINKQSFANTSEIENAFPVISSINNDRIHAEDTIVLKGKFWPEFSDRARIVFSANSPYVVISYKSDVIKLRLTPDEMIGCEGKYNIDFEIFEPAMANRVYISTGLNINLLSQWKILNQAAAAIRSKAVVVNNEAYLIEENNTGNVPFWKYQPLTDQWVSRSFYLAGTVDGQSLFVLNGELYGGFSNALNENSNFYRYNYSENNWFQRAKLLIPADATRLNAFVIANKLYVFFAGSNKKGVFNPLTNIWTMSNCVVPLFDKDATLLSYNGDYYVFKQESGSNIYKFDLITETFSPISIEGINSVNGCFFQLGNSLYCTDDCKMFEIEMTQKKLIEKPLFRNYQVSDPMNYTHYQKRAFLFSLNNLAYFMFEPNSLVTFSNAKK